MSCSGPFRIFQNDSAPYGISFRQWTIFWWKWLISIPFAKNPAFDPTGNSDDGTQNNSQVWFLAGTFGGPAVRTYIIPYGKAILFPVINYECSFVDEPTIKTESGLERRCKKEIDDIKDFYASLDRRKINLKKCRVESKCFSVEIPPNNCLRVAGGDTVMASDGYWLFFEPLTQGEHQLSTYGSCMSGRIKIGCNFKLTIK